jgi:hypothetical protein
MIMEKLYFTFETEKKCSRKITGVRISVIIRMLSNNIRNRLAYKSNKY